MAAPRLCRPEQATRDMLASEMTIASSNATLAPRFCSVEELMREMGHDLRDMAGRKPP
jgi:hypothetical protein